MPRGATEMARFSVSDTPLDGLKLVRRQPLEDARGSLTRLYCADDFLSLGIEPAISQINRSVTRPRGAVRGLHYQHPPFAEGKFVTCLRGEVFDVAVDLRAGSATLLRWHGEVLSAHNLLSFYIPPGFAHGFQTLSEDCELLYFHSRPYRADAEDALNALDPSLGIEWPLAIGEMSERDRVHRLVDSDFRGVVL
jgi:dTDP-4-dehydrorhamnose 3,5-epimerase